MKKKVCDMTRKEFDKLPESKWGDIITCNSIVLLPTRRMHDSGYRCMDFVAVRNGIPICRLSGYSDVMHIEGFGGYGYKWVDKYGHCPDMIPTNAWNIDCLSKSGLLQIFVSGKDIICGQALSSFEIYSKEINKQKSQQSVV